MREHAESITPCTTVHSLTDGWTVTVHPLSLEPLPVRSSAAQRQRSQQPAFMKTPGALQGAHQYSERLQGNSAQGTGTTWLCSDTRAEGRL